VVNPSDQRAAQDPSQWGTPNDGAESEQGKGSARRSAKAHARARAREARWQRNRFAVPYYTDGPKVTFGLIWFVALLASIFTATPVMVVVIASVSGLAAAQTSYAFFPRQPTAWMVSGLSAVVITFSGSFGSIALLAGLLVGVLLAGVQSIVVPVRGKAPFDLFQMAMRSAVPVGLAGGSMVALARVEVGAIVGLVLLISAYETADFTVGSGSTNAVEGPVSGIVALAAVTFVLWTTPPLPFVPTTMVLFGLLAGVAAPLGQILASALLPRGSSWAPALRRLDSYLVAAPLWLLLLERAPVTTTT